MYYQYMYKKIHYTGIHIQYFVIATCIFLHDCIWAHSTVQILSTSVRLDGVSEWLISGLSRDTVGPESGWLIS